MKTINENYLEEDDLKIEFVGWTNYSNEQYTDLSDEIQKNMVADEENKLSGWKPASGKEKYVELLQRANQLSDMLITNRIYAKGIKFDGPYHQNGQYGTPLIKINDLGIFKWTCSFRYWGGIMESAGFGESYCDWAWMSSEDPVTPDMIKNENLIG
ncbi:MAG: hypothetical protein IKX70_04810 [Treponema sp.]|nr:hypothetical protein [Treponema sp.]